MTTTEHFQKVPDYFSSPEECAAARRRNVVTNPRYKNFKQTHFTAGDEDQFQEYRSETNGEVCIPRINLDDNKFKNIDLSPDLTWVKYQNLNATAVLNTFRYMFNKFKKGIFVKIQDNKLRVFLPFSKKNFVNEWGNKIKIDPRFGNMFNFAKYINRLGKKNFRVSVSKYPENWYANNCLVRYEYPINEGDTNVPNMSDMLKTLCAHRRIPDIEFFINRRDFPVIKKNSTEGYDHMFGDNHPLLSHEYDQYAPILSMVTTDEYADVPIPTGDDWARVSSYEGKFFGKACRTYPNISDFKTDWKNKKPTAVFRGASTGCGVTIDTNVRLKLAYISATTPSDEYGPLLDAGITKWQLRPRKLKDEKYLQTINVPQMNKLGITLVPFLTPLQQSEYKYLIHVDGHVSAFRLSLELSMGCCILLADSKYRIWYRPMLEPMVHYVPVKADLSDLVSKIRWCRAHDKKCKKIAKNAKKFYLKYLQKNGVLDYLQKLIISLKNETGVYLYNTETPLRRQIRLESKLDTTYPVIPKTVEDINTIPRQARSFGILKGLEWIINMVNDQSSFSDVAKKGDIIFTNKNKTVIVQKYTLAGFSFVIKGTSDRMKELENIHEAYIGTMAINNVVKYIPNFAYVFGKYDGEYKSTVIMEHIFGSTLGQWIESRSFNMRDFIFILIQLAMALEVAQKQIGFVHWDLTPWNIMIQTLPRPIAFDYMIDGKNIFRVHTKIIPVIIDYGKSHVIHNKEHHGYINMYKVSTIQDIISILVTSLGPVTNLNLSSSDVDEVIKLANFMSRTEYRQRPFRKTGAKGVSDVRYFILKAKKYTELISSNKYQLENKSPLDFIEYVAKNFRYKFPYERIDIPVFRINKGNPRQVYEYILSSSQEEKIQSFVNVFDRINTCEFPKPVNLFFAYFAAQTLEDNISSVYLLMKRFLERERVETEMYDKIYERSMKRINKTYKKILKKKSRQATNEKVEYKIDERFAKLQHASYNEQTFLLPDVIFNLLGKNRTKIEDLSEYKDIIERILLNDGKFKLSAEHKEYYLNNFKHLLLTNSLIMKTNSANINTLYNTSEGIYETDNTYLHNKLRDIRHNTPSQTKSNCKSAEEYITIYGKINKLTRSTHSDDDSDDDSDNE